MASEPAPPPVSGFTRSLGTAGVLFLTLSVATPASSVFIIMPGMFQVAGTGAVWAMVIAGLVCVATAMIYAELSSIWPVVGGEYVMVARTLGPMAGFVMLGINAVNNLIFLPVAGLGVSAVLGAVIPDLPVRGTAVAVVATCTLVGLLNIRINAAVTAIFLVLEVAALAFVSALGLLHAERSPVEMLSSPVAVGPAGAVPADATAIGVAATIAIFALNGYGAAVYFGEELHDAPRRIARTVLLALGLTLMLEGVPLIAALIGAGDLDALLRSDNPFELLASEHAGPDVSRWLTIGVTIAVVNAIIAWVLACARFFYGTGRDRSWGRPLDAWLQRIHPRFGSPWAGTLIIGLFGIALCFLPLRLLEVWSGTGLVAIYAGLAVASVAARRQGAAIGAPYRMPWYPAAPVLTLLALAYVVWTNWLDPTDGRPALIATAAQVAVCAAYYLLILRRRQWSAVVPEAQDAAGAANAGSKSALPSLSTRSSPEAIPK